MLKKIIRLKKIFLLGFETTRLPGIFALLSTPRAIPLLDSLNLAIDFGTTQKR